MDNETKNLDIKEVLPEALLEGLSELHKSDLQDRLNQIIEARVSEQVNVAAKSAEVSYDAMMNERLEKVLTKIEENYKRGLKEAYNHLRQRERSRVSTLKENFAKILEAKETYYKNKIADLKENTIKQMEIKSNNFRRNLTDMVLEFVETEIEKHVPTDMLRESIKNNSAMKLVANLKNILNVNEASCRESIKQPLREAVTYMNEQVKNSKSLIKENAELKEQLNESNARIAEAERAAFLSEKLSTVPSIDQRNYLRRVCEGMDKEWIEQNFELSKKFFRESLEAERQTLAKRTMEERKQLQKNTKREAGVARIARAINEHRQSELSKVQKTQRVISESVATPHVSEKTARLSSIFKDIEQDETSGM